MKPERPARRCNEDNSIVRARPDDERLLRAAARARNRLPEFLAALSERSPGVQFFIKARFPRLDGAGHKHMWVRVSSLEGEVFVGILDSDPQGKVAVASGESVRVPMFEIEDWLFDRGGQKRTGGFSIPVLEQIDRENSTRRK